MLLMENVVWFQFGFHLQNLVSSNVVFDHDEKEKVIHNPYRSRVFGSRMDLLNLFFYTRVWILFDI